MTARSESSGMSRIMAITSDLTFDIPIPQNKFLRLVHYWYCSNSLFNIYFPSNDSSRYPCNESTYLFSFASFSVSLRSTYSRPLYYYTFKRLHPAKWTLLLCSKFIWDNLSYLQYNSNWIGQQTSIWKFDEISYYLAGHFRSRLKINGFILSYSAG